MKLKIHNLCKRQTGATLMEVMIAMSISLVVTASMIALMANSLGSTARIIQMTKLSDDMRVALQMMSRDVRRASYNANSMYCYANTDCADDVIVDKAGNPILLTKAGDITPVDRDKDGVNDCFIFLMDRDYDGDSTKDSAGGFRLRHVPLVPPVAKKVSVGVIEMWTGDSTANCGPDGAAEWVQITDPKNIDISAFSVSEFSADGKPLSYTQNILETSTKTVSMKIRKFRLTIEGELVLDSTIWREMEDIIAVRNDLLL